jgi:hypothetical protein
MATVSALLVGEADSGGMSLGTDAEIGCFKKSQSEFASSEIQADIGKITIFSVARCFVMHADQGTSDEKGTRRSDVPTAGD